LKEGLCCDLKSALLVRFLKAQTGKSMSKLMIRKAVTYLEEEKKSEGLNYI